MALPCNHESEAITLAFPITLTFVPSKRVESAAKHAQGTYDESGESRAKRTRCLSRRAPCQVALFFQRQMRDTLATISLKTASQSSLQHNSRHMSFGKLALRANCV